MVRFDGFRPHGLDGVPQILEAMVLLTPFGQLLGIIVALEPDCPRVHRMWVFGRLGAVDLHSAAFIGEAIHIDSRNEVMPAVIAVGIAAHGIEEC